jgi:hypothetical protein
MRRMNILVLALIAGGCGSIADAGSVLTFEGTVYSAADGQPIAGAHVSLEQAIFVFQSSAANTTTDEHGHYTLQHSAHCDANSDLYSSPGNAYLMVASANGYAQLSSVNQSIALRCVTATQSVNFPLQRLP